MTVNEEKRPRELEQKNAQLKRLVADQALNIEVQKRSEFKKVVGPGARNTSALYAMKEHELSQRQTSRYLGLARTTLGYKAK